MVYIRGPPSFEGEEACNGITSTISTKRVKTLPRLIFYDNNNDQLQFPHAHTLPAFSFFFLIHPHIGIAKLN